MKLRAVCVCRNEADIIQETLLHAATFCDEIYVYDLGSDDGTVAAVREIENGTVHLFDSVALPFHDGRHADVWRSLWRADPQSFDDRDWYMILDADEQFVGDPRPILFSPSYRWFNLQRVWHINNVFTTEDLRAWNNGDRRVCAERLKYFRLNILSPRFFRCGPNPPWPSEPNPRHPFGRIFPETCRYEGWRVLFNRHFQYRSPEQIRRRLETRAANAEIGGIAAPQWHARPIDHLVRSPDEASLWDEARGIWNLPLKDHVRVRRAQARNIAATIAKLAVDRIR